MCIPSGSWEEQVEGTGPKPEIDKKIIKEYLFTLNEFKSPELEELYLATEETIYWWLPEYFFNLGEIVKNRQNVEYLEIPNDVTVFKMEKGYCNKLQNYQSGTNTVPEKITEQITNRSFWKNL